MRLKMNYVSIHYLNGSASVPSFGRLFGLFALGHPERLQKTGLDIIGCTVKYKKHFTFYG